MQERKHIYTLGASERLKHRKKIDELFRLGQHISLGTCRVVYHFGSSSEVDGGGKLLVGVGVSKRHFKKAVDRNQIKRWLRESVRLEKGLLAAKVAEKGLNLDLFILYSSAVKPDYQQCVQQVKSGVQKLIKKLEVR